MMEKVTVKRKHLSRSMDEEHSSKPDYRLTPGEMWSCTKGYVSSWGIKGYEAPRNYFDYHQVKWLKQRKVILDAHKRQWPPSDWPRPKDGEKAQPPKRPNFLDDSIKWANSFNDPVKSEEMRANLEGRGTFKKPEPKHPPNLREKYLSDEKAKKERKAALPAIPDYKVNGIEEAKKNIEEQKEKFKSQYQKDLERYTKERPLWPRCDRVTIVSDAEYVGEQIPFYNSFKKEGEDSSKEKLFSPNKDFVLKKAPVWGFQNKNPIKLPNDNMRSRDDQIKEKVEQLKNRRNMSDKDLIINVQASFDKVKNRGHNYILFKKPFDYANTDQYKSNKEQKPDFSPGPQFYFKCKELDKNERPNVIMEEKEVNGKPTKVYYMSRKRVDYRQYKPTRRSVF